MWTLVLRFIVQIKPYNAIAVHEGVHDQRIAQGSTSTRYYFFIILFLFKIQIQEDRGLLVVGNITYYRGLWEFSTFKRQSP